MSSSEGLLIQYDDGDFTTVALEEPIIVDGDDIEPYEKLIVWLQSLDGIDWDRVEIVYLVGTN